MPNAKCFVESKYCNVAFGNLCDMNCLQPSMVEPHQDVTLADCSQSNISLFFEACSLCRHDGRCGGLGLQLLLFARLGVVETGEHVFLLLLWLFASLSSPFATTFSGRTVGGWDRRLQPPVSVEQTRSLRDLCHASRFVLFVNFHGFIDVLLVLLCHNLTWLTFVLLIGIVIPKRRKGLTLVLLLEEHHSVIPKQRQGFFKFTSPIMIIIEKPSLNLPPSQHGSKTECLKLETESGSLFWAVCVRFLDFTNRLEPPSPPMALSSQPSR